VVDSGNFSIEINPKESLRKITLTGNISWVVNFKTLKQNFAFHILRFEKRKKGDSNRFRN